MMDKDSRHDIFEHRNILEGIPANRQLIEQLYVHGKITADTREHALNFLYPHSQWRGWISRMLLMIGAALVLSGIVYFFAFNWAKLIPAMKLSTIQFGIVGCLIGAYAYSLERINGQIFLLSASVLVGVFLAVFGQIYQTGADAYQLFMMWALLTFGWTLISNFPAQWGFWLAITNTFFVLWWEQAVLPAKSMEFFLCIYLMLFNGTALALREYFAVQKSYHWLEARWTRMVLALATLVVLLIPLTAWISSGSVFGLNGSTDSIRLSGAMGLVGHAAMYGLYRYKLPDMWPLAATVLSSCIALELASFKLLEGVFGASNFLMLLLMGLWTLCVFSCAIVYLWKTAKKLDAHHAPAYNKI